MSDRAQSGGNQIRELKVSGHTMALEPGTYCVYNAPGGVAAGENGLPGVRITAAPGPFQSHVSIAAFNAEGWIGTDSAALVRVSGNVAEVLVTVYQVPGSQAEAPNLQVVRLIEAAASKSAPPGAPAAAAQPAASPEAVEVVAHVYGRGDVAGRMGNWMGEAGSQRWIEGFGIAPIDGIAAADIEYQAVLGRGWLSPWSEGGQFCGSRGMSLPILGMRIRLKGAAARSHRVVLSASFVDGTRVGPVGDGEACEAESLAALEAFQLAIVPLAAQVASPSKPAPAKVKRAGAEPKRTEPETAKPARKAGAKPGAPAARPAGRKAAAAKAPAAPAPVPKPPAAKTPAGKAPAAKPAAAKAAPPTATKPAGSAGKRTPATNRRR